MPTRRRQYRVHCIGLAAVKTGPCGWSGVRTPGGCECYGMPCSPIAPGLGCPNGVTWPCPHCNGSVTGRPIEHRVPVGGNRGTQNA